MMVNLNNRVKAELAPIDDRLMKHYDTTYTRDSEGHLVVCQPAVRLSSTNADGTPLTRYFQQLPGPAQSKGNDFSKLANSEFGQVLAGNNPDFEPVKVKFTTTNEHGRAYYGFEIPKSTSLKKVSEIIWFPEVTVVG